MASPPWLDGVTPWMASPLDVVTRSRPPLVTPLLWSALPPASPSDATAVVSKRSIMSDIENKLIESAYEEEEGLMSSQIWCSTVHPTFTAARQNRPKTDVKYVQ